MDEALSYSLMLEEMGDKDRAIYWKREKAKENLVNLNLYYESINNYKYIIDNTKQWLLRVVDNETDPDKLKEKLMLGAEIIQNCEQGILSDNASIAHYTKYPLYSDKRRHWYNTKEGTAWLKKQQKTS